MIAAMAKARANGIEIEWDSFGERTGEPILLVMGLGAQLLLWDEEFCQRLADRGHWVVRYDNRDVGLSTWFDAHGVPDTMQLMMEAQAGRTLDVPYSLDDMADDAVGLLDALGLARAHVVGASMGGMIAQTVAYRHPARVKSLVSIMSSTGSPSVPPAKPEVVGRLMMPPPGSRQAAIDQSVETWKVISGKGYPFDEKKVRERTGEMYDRANHPAGQARQLAAIPGAELLLVAGMGHDLPQPLFGKLVEAISSHVEKAARR